MDASPDGRYFVCAGKGRGVRVWDADGLQLATFAGRQENESIQFSPRGDAFVTSSIGSALSVFEVPRETSRIGDEELRALAAVLDVRDLTRAERERYANLLGGDNAIVLAGYRAVDALRTGTVLVGELVGRVKADTTLSEEVRGAALAIASSRCDDPSAIRTAVWDVVRSPGRSREEYLLALARIEAAARIAPADVEVGCVVGAAQYRAGLLHTAIDSLRRTDAKHAAGREHCPRSVAFLAMCHRALDDVAAARTNLARLRGILKAATESARSDAAPLVAEVESVVGAE